MKTSIQKGIYVKFKPEEVEILHDRMKEAGVQNMKCVYQKDGVKRVCNKRMADLNRVISLYKD